MLYFRTILLVAITALVMGCASQQNQPDDQDIPRLAERDPIIQIEAEKNAKLFKQTEKEMAESMQVPDSN